MSSRSLSRAGVTARSTSNQPAGQALVIYTCLFILPSGIVLLIADREEPSRPRGKGLGGALAQSLPPFAVLIAALL